MLQPAGHMQIYEFGEEALNAGPNHGLPSPVTDDIRAEMMTALLPHPPSPANETMKPHWLTCSK